MIDGHIHIEQGEYTPEWIDRFVQRAVEMGLSEIRLLEHCYRFEEFTGMYGSVCAFSDYLDQWFHRRAGVTKLSEYLALVDRVRSRQYPIDVKFGLEICYFREFEGFVADLTRDKGLDFLLGSVHFVDGFGFDHKPEHWEGMDVDRVCRRYYEDSICLAQSGVFDGIGHPDTIHLFGHTPTFSPSEYYGELARALAESHMYADENSGAERRYGSRLGMEHGLIRALKQENVPIITSSDAHCPEDVGYKIREMNELLSAI